MMRRQPASAYDPQAAAGRQSGQGRLRLVGRPGTEPIAKGRYLLRIFSTMAVVELFSTRPSTRTSPP